MKKETTVNKLTKQLITATLALLIAFTAVFAVPQDVQAAKVNQVKKVKTTAVTTSRIKVSWKKSTGVTGYKVYRATSKNGKYKEIKKIKNKNTTSYTDKKGLKAGKTYYYKVRGYKTSKGKTTYGAYSKAVKAKAVPAKVVLELAEEAVNPEIQNKNFMLLRWKKVKGVDGYAIYRAKVTEDVQRDPWTVYEDKLKYERVKTIRSASTTTWLDKGANGKGLEFSTDYYYKVRAFKKVKGKNIYGAYSNTFSAGTWDADDIVVEETEEEDTEDYSSIGGIDAEFGGDF